LADLLHSMRDGKAGWFELMMIGIAIVQILVCVLIFADSWSESGGALRAVDLVQLGSAVLLLGCTVAAIFACRSEHRRLEDMRRKIDSYAMGLSGVVSASFVTWHLTAAESDVALLALKGFETQEIADLRHATAGTVRAQLARVYAKAGVESRSGLQGLFLEDLMAGLPADSLDMATALSRQPGAGCAGERRLHS